MKIQYCPYCGTKLDDGARFCKNCGEPITETTHRQQEAKREEPFNRNRTERKTVYEGYIHKCPNCGEVLESFLTICPSCGYEIRDTKSATSVRELAHKLEDISAQKMVDFEEKNSVMKMIFGKDFKSNDEVGERLRQFEAQKNHEKASLIINFSVPNTKEDIFEFMILAASNIDTKRNVDDEVTKAWISKLEQVYQRAEITMSEHPDFIQIKSIYDKKKKELIIKKLTYPLSIIGFGVAWLFLFGLAWNPTVTIIIFLVILVLFVALIIVHCVFERK